MPDTWTICWCTNACTRDGERFRGHDPPEVLGGVDGKGRKLWLEAGLWDCAGDGDRVVRPLLRPVSTATVVM